MSLPPGEPVTAAVSALVTTDGNVPDGSSGRLEGHLADSAIKVGLEIHKAAASFDAERLGEACDPCPRKEHVLILRGFEEQGFPTLADEPDLNRSELLLSRSKVFHPSLVVELQSDSLAFFEEWIKIVRGLQSKSSLTRRLDEYLAVFRELIEKNAVHSKTFNKTNF